MKTIKIVVKQKHIDKGKVGSPTSCPIALAGISQGYKNVIVCYYPAGLLFKTTRKSYLLPLKAVDFICSFDGFHKVKPFRFTAKEITVK